MVTPTVAAVDRGVEPTSGTDLALLSLDAPASSAALAGGSCQSGKRRQ